jgi:glycosyltransferase involved in cell wall biosynthesis
MRICMLVTTDISNDPRVTKESTALAAFGHRVSVIGIYRDGNEAKNEIRDGVELERHDLWHMRLVRWLKSLRGRSASQGMFVSASQDTDVVGSKISIIVVSFLHQLQFVLHVAVTFLVFAMAALKHPADIYHAHDFDTLLPALFAGRLRKKRVIYDSHEYWYNERRDEIVSNAIIRWVERFGAPRCVQVFAVNESIAERMADHYGIAKPVILMNVPADVPTQAPAPLASDQPIQVLYHGGYTAGRGLESLVDAMALVKSPATLTFRGYGDIELALRAQARAAGLTDIIKFEKPVPMRELSRTATACQIGIIPYTKRVAEFALPNKIFEYMAAGLALVANDLTEFRRIVVGFQLGETCNTEDPVEIARAIDDLAGNYQYLNECRLRSWMVYHELFTWDKHKHVLLATYSEIDHKE